MAVGHGGYPGAYQSTGQLAETLQGYAMHAAAWGRSPQQSVPIAQPPPPSQPAAPGQVQQPLTAAEVERLYDENDRAAAELVLLNLMLQKRTKVKTESGAQGGKNGSGSEGAAATTAGQVAEANGAAASGDGGGHGEGVSCDGTRGEKAKEEPQEQELERRPQSHHMDSAVERRKQELLRGMRDRLRRLAAWNDTSIGMRERQLGQRSSRQLEIAAAAAAVAGPAGAYGGGSGGGATLYNEIGHRSAAAGSMAMAEMAAAYGTPPTAAHPGAGPAVSHGGGYGYAGGGSGGISAASGVMGHGQGYATPAGGGGRRAPSSRHKGVTLHQGRWAASIGVRGQAVPLGSYESEEDAYNAILR
ncbi:unnamed protein product [Phaeothamnion confervicola]